MKLIGVVVIAATLLAAVNAEFPDDPKPCRIDDNPCKVKMLQFLFDEKVSGYAPFNLPKIDPMEVALVRIQQGGNSPLQIDLNFTRSAFRGFKDAVVERIVGFSDNIAGNHELHILPHTASLIGDYSIQGKILILPISGTGTSNITMVRPKVTFKFAGTPKDRNGETYLSVRNLRMAIKPERVIFHFENLFNGDKELGDNMNQFLNDNWKEIYQEAEAPMLKSFSKIFQKVFNQVFSKYPYKKFFAE